jgi:hypothetical protein
MVLFCSGKIVGGGCGIFYGVLTGRQAVHYPSSQPTMSKRLKQSAEQLVEQYAYPTGPIPTTKPESGKPHHRLVWLESTKYGRTGAEATVNFEDSETTCEFYSAKPFPVHVAGYAEHLTFYVALQDADRTIPPLTAKFVGALVGRDSRSANGVPPPALDENKLVLGESKPHRIQYTSYPRSEAATHQAFQWLLLQAESDILSSLKTLTPAQSRGISQYLTRIHPYASVMSIEWEEPAHGELFFVIDGRNEIQVYTGWFAGNVGAVYKLPSIAELKSIMSNPDNLQRLAVRELLSGDLSPEELDSEKEDEEEDDEKEKEDRPQTDKGSNSDSSSDSE